ncbi:hypothetical protein Hanom_Chr08g00698021 [Helianthus anomalus]
MFNDQFFSSYTSSELVALPLHFFSSKQPQKSSSLSNESAGVEDSVSVQRIFSEKKH